MEQINDTRWKPSTEQAGIIADLAAEFAKEPTVAEALRRFAPFGPSMWAQIKSAIDPESKVLSYFDKISQARRDELFGELATVLKDIPRQRAIASRISETDILRTSKIRAVMKAVSECREKKGCERLVLVLGPTGAGKTMCANYLVDKLNARFVEVRDVWRTSRTGYVPLLDICRAAGMRTGQWKTCDIAGIQESLEKFLTDRSICLNFDEGEHFGQAAFNLLKLLLNKSRVVPVIYCVTSEFEKWERFWENEAKQICRRIHAIIQLDKIEMEDAAMFFSEKQFAEPDKALGLIVSAGNDFGHLSLIKRVAVKLDKVERASIEDVEEAIALARKQMARTDTSRQITKAQR